jgi:hypothetical protein
MVGDGIERHICYVYKVQGEHCGRKHTQATNKTNRIQPVGLLFIIYHYVYVDIRLHRRSLWTSTANQKIVLANQKLVIANDRISQLSIRCSLWRWFFFYTLRAKTAIVAAS